MLTFIEGSVSAPKGFKAAGIHCGIRRNQNKKDLAFILAEKPCDAAAVYTQNKVKGAPVVVTMRHLQNGRAQAVVCNRGYANTCSAGGVETAEEICAIAAGQANILPEDVINASTGVIGQPLPVEPIRAAFPSLAAALSDKDAGGAGDAILTTDTRKKELAVEFTLAGKTCRIGGIAKGSGMIHPNMATMLCFLTTDAAIDAAMLHEALYEVTVKTFNMVSVDRDTSTNDMVSIMASGLCGNERITAKNESYAVFSEALEALCIGMAREVARDGEGASKLLECTVSGAKTLDAARVVAKTVISSSLSKAALVGADANWGRVLCAVGYAETDLDIDKVDVSFESEKGVLPVCKGGMGISFSEEKARTLLVCDEVKINISLNDGDFSATAWGCDLTYDYVKINGDYRT